MERRTQRRVVRKSRKIRKNVFLLLTLALILCLGTFAMGAQKGRETKTYYEHTDGRKYHRTGDEKNIKKGNAKNRREMKELHLPSVNGDNS